MVTGASTSPVSCTRPQPQKYLATLLFYIQPEEGTELVDTGLCFSFCVASGRGTWLDLASDNFECMCKSLLDLKTNCWFEHRRQLVIENTLLIFCETDSELVYCLPPVADSFGLVLLEVLFHNCEMIEADLVFAKGF